MTADPPDRPDLRPSDIPATAASDTGERQPWPPSSILWPWLSANTLGFAVVTTVLIGIAVLGKAAGGVMGGIEALYCSGVVVGGFVGPLQAFVLRDQVPRLKNWQWIMASMLGGYAGLFLGAIISITITLPLPMLEEALMVVWPSVYGATLGISVGVGQVLVLAQHVRGLRRWWVASVLGRLLGWLSAQVLWVLLTAREATDFPHGLWHFLFVALLGAVGGLIYGGVTARAIPQLTPR